MSDVNEICQYLKDTGTYYLATCEGNQPHVRPFGTAHVFEEKLYIQTGLKKKVAQQIIKNPKVEITGMKKDGTWIRVSGELVLDERIEAQKSLLDAYPSLQKMYQAGDGNTAVFYFRSGKAEIDSFTAAPKELSL